MLNPKNIILATTILAMVIFISGCSSSSTSSINSALTATPTKIVVTDACSLLTPDEVATVFGEPVANPVVSTPVSTDGVCEQTCTYKAMAGSSASALMLNYTYGNGDAVIQLWTKNKNSAKTSPGYSEVFDLGDDAYYGQSELFFTRNGKSVSLSLTLANRTDTKPVNTILPTKFCKKSELPLR